jgi:ERCC4-type nuclease
MESSFTLDNRERKLIALLEKENITVAQLDIGDFEIKIDNLKGIEKRFVFERKTLGDLESSIKDGRWREQKMRCIASGCNIVYVIEGLDDKYFETNMSVVTAIINLILCDNIKIVMTKNLSGTADLIRSLMQRIKKDPGKYLLGSIINYSYEQCQIQSRKKNNLTHRTVLINQLCCVPGVSWKKAAIIIDTCSVSSIYDLCEKLKKNPDILQSCRGIGKSISHSLYANLIVGECVVSPNFVPLPN